MQSRMEQLIDEMEQYIASCKPQAFSKENIIVDKYHMEELISELKRRTPEEVKRYQKIMAQKEAIWDDARSKAEVLVSQATVQANELVSEHEIMQTAHARAQEVETMALQKAQDIESLALQRAHELVDAAAAEAEAMRVAAVQYTDDLLASIENLMAHAIQTTSSQYENMQNSLNQYYTVVTTNRKELLGAQQEETEGEQPEQPATTNTGEISLDLI